LIPEKNQRESASNQRNQRSIGRPAWQLLTIRHSPFAIHHSPFAILPFYPLTLPMSIQPNDPIPAHLADSTITGVIDGPIHAAGAYGLLPVRLPVGLAGGGDARTVGLAGRYFLARCGAQSEWERAERWELYWRRPLFVVDRRLGRTDQEERWQMALPKNEDPGYRWLAELPAGSPINLIGPLGNGLSLASTTRNLLVLANGPSLALALPALDAALDRGGRVALLLDLGADPEAYGPLPLELLPLAVEVQVVHGDEEWAEKVGVMLRWADQLYSVQSATRYGPLAQLIRQERFHVEPGFAQLRADAPLVCGMGACLACAVPLPSGGYTRSCVHGPIFDLAALVAK